MKWSLEPSNSVLSVYTHGGPERQCAHSKCVLDRALDPVLPNPGPVLFALSELCGVCVGGVGGCFCLEGRCCFIWSVLSPIRTWRGCSCLEAGNRLVIRAIPAVRGLGLPASASKPGSRDPTGIPWSQFPLPPASHCGQASASAK